MTNRLLNSLLAGIAVVLGTFNACAYSRGGGNAPLANINSARAARFPIRWRLGRIDPRFNLDSDQVKRAAERAIHVWESECGKQLFVYDASRGFPVDLVFDVRQQALAERRDGEAKLRTSTLALELAERNAHDALERFRLAEERVDVDAETFESSLEAYNRSVDYWNAEGGPPPDILARLDAQKARLASERSRVKQAQRESEAMRVESNRRADAYEDSIAHYNQAVREFNQRFRGPIREKVGDCLMLGTKAKRITIFAFDDSNHLSAVLAHEFGHALGLRHVNGDGALMSAVETGQGLGADIRLTERDRAELRRALRR